ncbi:MAG: 1-acyl-sn-glycerol-3-phosphate acyltransferase [Nitrospinota bacterium]|nr:MAG: 1-acyl-sn-glycerol-3-phosphate acyltransferase [Nitrospinota bacterium]
MGGIRRSLRYTGELLDAGYCPLVYPEGGRTTDGSLRPLRPGIGLMAVHLKVPIVPVILCGLFEVYSIHHRWPQPGSVRACIGEPMRFPGEKDYQLITRRIEDVFRQLFHSLQANG